ncbi:hypothetical protein ACIA5G_33685 [Amycolatopsis sp. NPDC051758]|uniref:hypothetical protein n=1 Tax=Amycolatopsis sp. NPDC051758 TaxID=3363935 RepID=UPI00379BA069
MIRSVMHVTARRFNRCSGVWQVSPDWSQLVSTELYDEFADRLSGIDPIASDPAVDGKYRMADYYSKRLDDEILEAIRKVTSIHLGGRRLVVDDETTTLAFLSRLRCVDSLSDYLILALQAVVEGRSYSLGQWEPINFQTEETGFLDYDFESQYASEVALVHISDLMANHKFNLKIPVRRFRLDKESLSNDPAPPYCFVSHSWVDKGMPDTEDGKFYRSLLLMVLAIYLDTGIEWFWVDYLSVTQNPDARELKARELEQIPGIVQLCSLYVSMSLEIYQYFSSAWCALETLSFLAWNPRCRPLDFMAHANRTTYRYGMNVVDPTKVNANEMIIYSFTDQPFTCGAAEDLDYLTEAIIRARNYSLARVMRHVNRAIKRSIGMADNDKLGIVIFSEVQQFLASMMNKGAKTPVQFLENINDVAVSVGFKAISPDITLEMLPFLEKYRAMCFVLWSMGVIWPGVRLRQGGAYDLDTSELTTEYAFHNQR